jgi:hypothetical protein
VKTPENKPFPKRLADIKDDNGTSLQSHAELLLEKADTAGLLTYMVFLSPDGNLFTTMSNIAVHEQPDLLHRIAAQMRKPAKSRTTLTSKEPQA